MAAADNSVEIQRLYDIATKLDADADKISTEPAPYEAMFDEILQGSKGAQKTKMLAAQFIPKYLKHFPKFTDQSINCLIDLCEEEDLSTRVHAIRALPVIAKSAPASLPKLADILGQLLQTELAVELDKVKQALVSLLQQDLKGTLTALFTQSLSEDEDLRRKAISFIFEKVVPMRDEINKNEDIQKSVADNVKKALPHVATAKEFQLFMDLLSSLNIYNTKKGATGNELLDFLADINAEFNAKDEFHVAKLSSCLQYGNEFLKKGATSSKFTSILAEKVLPSFGQMTEGGQVDVLQQLAEMCPHLVGSDAKALLPPVYEIVISQLPPPSETAPATTADEPKLNFSIIEAALYIFHIIASKAPGSMRSVCGINVVTGQPSAMSTELAVEKKQDLDARLKYLEQRTKKYVQHMEAARKELLKSPADKKSIIDVAIKATRNIILLAQNLLQRQPSFPGPAGKMALSVKPAKSQTAKVGGPSTTTTTSTTKSPTLAATATGAAKKKAPQTQTQAPAQVQAPAQGQNKNARPAFENVYVPPNRQAGEGKKRATTEVAEEQQPALESQKKFKGRGSSKFQQV